MGDVVLIIAPLELLLVCKFFTETVEEKHPKLSDYLNQILGIAILKALQGLASIHLTPKIHLQR